MRKVILITLVLAVLALFAVGCQPQQPQAGKAFYWEPSEPTQMDYGYAMPAAPVQAIAQPMPAQQSGTIGYGKWDTWEEEWAEGEDRSIFAPGEIPGLFGSNGGNIRTIYAWAQDSAGLWTPMIIAET